MTDPQEAYRIWQGADHQDSDPWAASPRSLMFRFGLLCGLGGLFIGLLTMAIFVAH